MSHGESFLEILGRRLDGPGLFLLDEPESALSFTGSLGLPQGRGRKSVESPNSCHR